MTLLLSSVLVQAPQLFRTLLPDEFVIAFGVLHEFRPRLKLLRSLPDLECRLVTDDLSERVANCPAPELFEGFVAQGDNRYQLVLVGWCLQVGVQQQMWATER